MSPPHPSSNVIKQKNRMESLPLLLHSGGIIRHENKLMRNDTAQLANKKREGGRRRGDLRPLQCLIFIIPLNRIGFGSGLLHFLTLSFTKSAVAVQACRGQFSSMTSLVKVHPAQCVCVCVCLRVFTILVGTKI